MASGDQNAFLGFFCCAIVLVVLNAIFWGNFASGMTFYEEQVPGMCLDGRKTSESLMEATGLSVDDSRRNKQNVNMHCAFRVAFYPCSDESAQECLNSNYAAEPANKDNRANWPLREAGKAGLDCTSGGIVGNRCSESNWDCSGIGRCDGYHKTVRMCASKFKTQPYSCFGIPDKPGEGVRIEEGGWPVGWLIGGILSAITTLAVCAMTILVLKDEENLCMKIVIQMAVWLVCWGLIVGFVFIVRALTGGTEEPRGMWSVNYADIAISVNGTAVLPSEEPPDEGLPVWAVVLIVIASVCGGAILVFLCCMMIEGATARQNVVLTNAPPPTTDSSDEAKAGSPAITDSSNEAKAGYTAHRQKARLFKKSQSTVHQYSKKDLNDLVKDNSSNLSNRQIVGHHVLNVAEDHVDAVQRAHSKLHFALTVAKVVNQSSEPPEGFARCTKDVTLQKGDAVLLDSNKESVHQLCEKDGTTWNDDKAKYLGQEGIVHGKDWLGPGVRVLFKDGHWWSYHPDSLFVKLDQLDAARKALLSSDVAEGTVLGAQAQP